MSLLPFQITHKNNLIKSLDNYKTALDSSDTGTGKTYVACAIAKEKNLRPIVICPKSVISNWKKTLDLFSVQPLGIANYECIRNGNWYQGFGKTKCEYFDDFNWINLPENVIFIFDEVHNCKNKSTLNSKVLLSTHPSSTDRFVLMLSATASDKIDNFGILSYMLGFVDSVDLYDIKIKMLSKTDDPATVLRKFIFPDHGSRMKISNIKDMPQNIIIPEIYDLDEEKKKTLKECYQILNDIKQYRKQQKKEAENKMAKIIRARQHIEACKIPLIVEESTKILNEGNSVVIFVNFRETLNVIATELNIKSKIYGGQTTAERDKAINDFQSNKNSIIICMIQSGGTGISLHDVQGGHPRVSIISPPWSAQLLVQALGRIARSGGKTKCLQKIIYCSGCVEEKIKDVLDRKIKIYHDFNNV
jgi:superfamily II DNA or RNA helicase